jgi:hypothetical protein
MAQVGPATSAIAVCFRPQTGPCDATGANLQSIFSAGLFGSVGDVFRPLGEELVALRDGEHHAARNPVLHLASAGPNLGRSIAPVPSVLYLVGHVSVKISREEKPRSSAWKLLRSRTEARRTRDHEQPWSRSVERIA